MVYSPNQWGIGNKGYSQGIGGSKGSGGGGFLPSMLGSMMGSGGFGGGGTQGAAAKPMMGSGGPMAMAIGPGGGSGPGEGDDEKEQEVMDTQIQTAWNQALIESDIEKKKMDKYYSNYLKSEDSYWLGEYQKQQQFYNMSLGDLNTAWKPLYSWHQKSGTDLDYGTQTAATTHGLGMW